MPNAPAYVDLNGDDGVSVFDFTGFSSNFGVGVTYMTGLQNVVIAANVVDSPSDDVDSPSDDVAAEQTVGRVSKRVDAVDWTMRRRDESITDELRGSDSVDWEALEDVIDSLLR